MASTIVRRQTRVALVELTHPHAPTPRIRFRLVPRESDTDWVSTDGEAEWGRFFEQSAIREFAHALLEMVGE